MSKENITGQESSSFWKGLEGEAAKSYSEDCNRIESLLRKTKRAETTGYLLKHQEFV